MRFPDSKSVTYACNLLILGTLQGVLTAEATGCRGSSPPLGRWAVHCLANLNHGNLIT